jgi:hypothetical protein
LKWRAYDGASEAGGGMGGGGAVSLRHGDAEEVGGDMDGKRQQMESDV